jgi:hypothetical protein
LQRFGTLSHIVATTILLLLFVAPTIQASIPTAVPADVGTYGDRIEKVRMWLFAQEVEYSQGQTGYAASASPSWSGIDSYRIYSDDNARLAMVLTQALQYRVLKQGDRPSWWDDRIKVAINFVLAGKTPTKDFYDYWQLPGSGKTVGWRTSGEFYFWNAAVLEGLAITAAKMRWNHQLGVSSSDFGYYDNVVKSVEDSMDTWQATSQQPDGSWILTYETPQGTTKDTEVAENGMILAALVSLAYYERNLGNQQLALKHIGWAEATARWLIGRQERRADTDWSQGGGYGGLYNDKDNIVQYSGANARAIFGLALYGLNVESLLQSPTPSKADIADVMKAWVDGFVTRTHDANWGPINAVTSTGAFAYPKYTYVAAALGTATVAAYDFLLDNKYIDWATNLFRWITQTNEMHKDFQNACTRGCESGEPYGFFVGINDDQPWHSMNYDTNVETNLETLQLMTSLDASSLAWFLDSDSFSAIPTPSTTSHGPCPTATAAANSFLENPVSSLRQFRDGEVNKTILGSAFLAAFNHWYYSWSPSVAHLEERNTFVLLFARAFVTPVIGVLMASRVSFDLLGPIDPELGILAFGLTACALTGIVYLSPIVYCVSRLLRRKIGAGAFVVAISVGMFLALYASLYNPAGTFGASTALLVVETLLLASLATSMSVSRLSMCLIVARNEASHMVNRGRPSDRLIPPNKVEKNLGAEGKTAQTNTQRKALKLADLLELAFP